MSKSIYEEALEKINIEFDAWERSEKIELIEIIEEALEKAQKQEKLLELYKEINNKRKELITITSTGHYTRDWKLGTEIRDIQDKIKELENEN